MSVMSNYAHGQFCWVDLMAHDMVTAQAFYQELFGWSAELQDTQGGPPYGIFMLNGKQVAGFGQMSDEMKSQGIPPIWSSYINVDNLNATVAKVADMGGSVMMPPIDVMEAGRMAIIVDPGGAAVSLWEKNQHIGAELRDEPNCFCWNELPTRDIAQARTFYAGLLGWEYQDHPGTPTEYNIILNRGEMNGGLMLIDEQWGDMPSAWSVYFAVENCDNTVAKLETLGGKVCVPAFDMTVGRMAVVSDPRGGTFCVIQMNPPTEA